MEIIKYNEIFKKKKYLLSFSIYKMLDSYQPFDIYFNSFKSFLNIKQDIFDIRIYFDYSVNNEIKNYINTNKDFEFYNFNYDKLRIGDYHHGVFAKFANFLSLTKEYSSEYEYVYLVDVLYNHKLINWDRINFIIKNNIDTFYHYFPKGDNKYKISLPLLTRKKIDVFLMNKYMNDIFIKKYDNIINK